MISSKKLLIASSLVFAAGSLSAQAENLEFNADIGASVIHLSGDSLVATTYYGLRGSLEVCDAKAQGFHLCGGISGFTTLEGVNKTTGALTVKTDVSAIGGFVKAKTNLTEGWAFASYAGVSQFQFKHDSNLLSTFTENVNVLIAGVELDKQIRGNISMSLKGEIGRFIDTSIDRNLYSFQPGIKVKF